MTLLTLLVLSGVYWFAGWQSPSYLQLVAVTVLVTLIVAIGVLTWVRSYELMADRVRIRMLFWHRDVFLSDVTAVEMLPGALANASRIFGNGGFLAYAGRFRSNELGEVQCYVSDVKHTVVLRGAGMPVLISPGDPAGFIEEINRVRLVGSSTGAEGMTVKGEQRTGGSIPTVVRSTLDAVLVAINVLSLVIAVAMGIYAYFQVPAGAPVAIHFNSGGTPNGWAGSLKGLFTIPFGATVLLALYWLVPLIKRSISELERRFVAVVLAVVSMILVLGQWQIVSYALRTLETP